MTALSSNVAQGIRRGELEALAGLVTVAHPLASWLATGSTDAIDGADEWIPDLLSNLSALLAGLERETQAI
jgi:hypothetical protein